MALPQNTRSRRQICRQNPAGSTSIEPQSDTNAIKEFLASFKGDGPVCVDVPPESPGQGFGCLSSWFRVSAIPAWIVVGPEGKVAGHSLRPNEAFQLANRALSNLVK